MIYSNAAGAINIASITLDAEGPAVGASLLTAEAGIVWMATLQAGSDVIVNMKNPSKASCAPEVTPDNATV